MRYGGRFGAGIGSKFRMFDRCAASCSAESTVTPRARESA